MDTATELFDSRPETLAHINRVKDLLIIVRSSLACRGDMHDASKLHSPEKEGFDATTTRLKGLVYGSPEYKDALADLKPTLDHHYRHNSHHPEYYAAEFADASRNDNNFVRINDEEVAQGVAVARMTLLDLIEMLCDWKAAGERHADGGNIRRSLEVNKVRFGMDVQLVTIFEATIKELGW